MDKIQDREKNMIKAFLFDLDGVLTDTSEFHFSAWKRLADEESVPFNREDNEALRGVGRRESLDRMLNGRPISEETAQAWMERKNKYYVELVSQMGTTNLLPGVMDLLIKLRAAKIKVAVASASKNAQMVMDRLQLWPMVDAVLDGSSVSRSKPAPDLFLAAAKKLGVPPAECLVVEDAAAGVDAGKAGGMRTLGLGPEERVGHADLVLPDLVHADLDQILARL
jgi:beta-phosphoglucomutase